jgi:hypothetical protein
MPSSEFLVEMTLQSSEQVIRAWHDVPHRTVEAYLRVHRCFQMQKAYRLQALQALKRRDSAIPSNAFHRISDD